MSKSSPRTDHPPVIGITGGIGSGKSIVANFWQLLGPPCFQADHVARNLLSHDPEVQHQVRTLLGTRAFQGSAPDRAWIASQVFADEELRKGLNAIIHPRVGEAFEAWKQRESQHPYLLKEAAIIFEIGQQAAYEYITLVEAPEHIRIKRVMDRSGMTEAEVRKRMQAQWSDERKRAGSQFVVVNDDATAVIPQVLAIHARLMAGFSQGV